MVLAADRLFCPIAFPAPR